VNAEAMYSNMVAIHMHKVLSLEYLTNTSTRKINEGHVIHAARYRANAPARTLMGSNVPVEGSGCRSQ